MPVLESCSCGEPLQWQNRLLACLHCDYPCKRKRCEQCKRMAVKP